MTAETKITIADEGARRAVECAIWWSVLPLVMGQSPLDGAVYGAGDEAARFPWAAGSHKDAGNLISALQAAHDAAQTVRAVALPAEVVVPVTAAKMAECLEDCATSIEEYGEEFWKLPNERREMVGATRDAARRLLAEIAPAAVA